MVLRHYIFNLNDREYEKLSDTRVYRSWSNKLTRSIRKQDNILIGLKRKNEDTTIIAEYEIIKPEIDKRKINFNMEPIYQAPPNTGVTLNSIVLSTLLSFPSLDVWERALDNKIIMIDNKDFIKLSDRLTVE